MAEMGPAQPSPWRTLSRPRCLSDGAHPSLWQCHKLAARASAALHLSDVLRLREQLNEALKFNERARELREKELGQNHPDVIQVRIEKGKIHQDKGDYDQADQCWAEAQKTYTPDSEISKKER